MALTARICKDQPSFVFNLGLWWPDISVKDGNHITILMNQMNKLIEKKPKQEIVKEIRQFEKGRRQKKRNRNLTLFSNYVMQFSTAHSRLNTCLLDSYMCLSMKGICPGAKRRKTGLDRNSLLPPTRRHRADTNQHTQSVETDCSSPGKSLLCVRLCPFYLHIFA